MRYLSEADKQVLALALELKGSGLTPLIVTDDYSIQNVANKIGVEFTSLMTFGIKFRFKWISILSRMLPKISFRLQIQSL